jgi:O-acetyl-ADP-ribose deacetylase (regulator of RNase III)
MIEVVHGNLLEAKVDALVNAVNTVGVMGKGIALQFRITFPDNFVAYKRECTAGNLELGQMFVYQTGSASKPYYIINFPTKKHWVNKSRIEFVRNGLGSLVAEIQKLKIGSVAIPALGCGCGGLSWQKVRGLIEEAVEPLTDVQVLLFEPPNHGRRGKKWRQ